MLSEIGSRGTPRAKPLLDTYRDPNDVSKSAPVCSDTAGPAAKNKDSRY
jgi:hypothetical protein